MKMRWLSALTVLAAACGSEDVKPKAAEPASAPVGSRAASPSAAPPVITATTPASPDTIRRVDTLKPSPPPPTIKSAEKGAAKPGTLMRDSATGPIGKVDEKGKVTPRRKP